MSGGTQINDQTIRVFINQDFNQLIIGRFITSENGVITEFTLETVFTIVYSSGDSPLVWNGRLVTNKTFTTKIPVTNIGVERGY